MLCLLLSYKGLNMITLAITLCLSVYVICAPPTRVLCVPGHHEGARVGVGGEVPPGTQQHAAPDNAIDILSKI